MRKEKFSIFYTDDDPDDQELFRDVINEMDSNLDLYIQNDGAELITLLDNPPPHPQLIFLDLNMPVKNGIEVLKEIRETERLRDFPVVIFSTSDDENAIQTTRELGANFYITKPTSYNLLKKAIAYTIAIDWKNFKPGITDFVYREN